MEHAFRLTFGQDLKQEIALYAKKHNIKAGVIVCGVGCLQHARIRKADGCSVYEEHAPFEIVSLQGTVSVDGCHLHIALSNEETITIGGHLLDGCLVNTTVEVVILELHGYRFTREFDDTTGYKELCIDEIRE